jgi:hypothetical protein
MGAPVTMQRWELWALIIGLVTFGAVVGAPLGVALFAHLTSGRALAERTEHDLRVMTERALKRKDALAMRKLTLAVIVPNEASLADLGAALVDAATDAARKVGGLDHANDLYAPVVDDDGARWACKVEHVSLLG